MTEKDTKNRLGRPKGTPKTGGRQKGTPNRVTASVKEWLSALIDKNRKQVERDLKQLEPRERLMMLEKLMQYVVPKQQAVRASVDFDLLTDGQLDMIVNEMTKDFDDETTD